MKSIIFAVITFSNLHAATLLYSWDGIPESSTALLNNNTLQVDYTLATESGVLALTDSATLVDGAGLFGFLVGDANSTLTSGTITVTRSHHDSAGTIGLAEILTWDLTGVQSDHNGIFDTSSVNALIGEKSFAAWSATHDVAGDQLIARYELAITGLPAQVTMTAVDVAFFGAFGNQTDEFRMQLSSAPVPEPSSALLALFGALFAFRRNRR